MDDLERGREAKETDIKAEVIMRRIREDIRRRRTEAEAQGIESDEAQLGQSYTSEGGTRFNERVYRDLQEMHSIYDKIGVGLLLSGSPVPLIAPLVQRVRSMLHRLVIYYVNRLAATQADFNECVVRTLTALVGELDEGVIPSRVEELEKEVADLRAQIGQLRAKLECESE